VRDSLAERQQRPTRMGPRPKKHDEERGDTEKGTEGKLVAAGDGPAQAADSAQTHPTRPPGQGALPSGSKEDQNDTHADNSSKECSQEYGKESAAYSKKSTDHKHHFDVAKAHAFAAANRFVEKRCRPEKAAAQNRSEHGVEDSGGPAWEGGAEMAAQEHAGDAVGRRYANGKCNAQANAEPIDEVWQDALAVVGNDQHYQDTTETKPLKRGDGEAKTQIAGHKKQGGDEFDGRIHRGNRSVTVAAFAAQDHPADYRNIIVCLDSSAAFRATRPRRHDGDTRRDPRDADVQKAANQQSQEEKYSDDHTLL
jgi:hypothetical protein